MSHTVLNSSSHRQRSHTMLDEISGRFEVYWEQWTRKLRKDIGQKQADEVTTESRSSKRKGHASGLSNVQSIKANFVFD